MANMFDLFEMAALQKVSFLLVMWGGNLEYK